MSIGVVEVGSTFTKGYVAHSPTEIEALPIVSIEFKKHREDLGRIPAFDLEALAEYVGLVRARSSMVHVAGTSAFRSISGEELTSILSSLGHLEQVTFEVVSAESERSYTGYGAIRNLEYPGNIAVMVGGGGSTEVSVYKGSEAIDRALSAVGVVDVNRVFPDLAESVATSSTATVVEWIEKRLTPVAESADLLVLAGGDFPLLYTNAGYPVESNPFSSDPEKAYMLSNAGKRAQDEVYFHERSLEEFRLLTPDTPTWWDGTRAMCCFVSAVANQLGATKLIPTRVSMVYGIASKLWDAHE